MGLRYQTTPPSSKLYHTLAGLLVVNTRRHFVLVNLRTCKTMRNVPQRVCAQLEINTFSPPRQTHGKRWPTELYVRATTIMYVCTLAAFTGITV